MIYSISGVINEIDSQGIYLSYNNICIYLYSPRSSLMTAETKITLYTHLAWSQENGPSLFGFSTVGEKNLFLLLTSCTGIGPKAALTILSTLPPALCAQAIISKNSSAFTKIPGIGTKKADLIILELKDKIQKIFPLLQNSIQPAHFECIEILKALGYEQKEINKALPLLQENQNISVQELITKAVQIISM